MVSCQTEIKVVDTASPICAGLTLTQEMTASQATCTQ